MKKKFIILTITGLLLASLAACGRAGGRQIKKRRTGKPDEIDAGFTSDLREKAIFLSDG